MTLPMLLRFARFFIFEKTKDFKMCLGTTIDLFFKNIAFSENIFKCYDGLSTHEGWPLMDTT